jgi:hypothetical protein
MRIIHNDIARYVVNLYPHNTTLTGEKGIQSNIEVDNRCAKSNLLTDKVSLLYTVGNQIIYSYYRSGNCGKSQKTIFTINLKQLPTIT